MEIPLIYPKMKNLAMATISKDYLMPTGFASTPPVKQAT